MNKNRSRHRGLSTALAILAAAAGVSAFASSAHAVVIDNVDASLTSDPNVTLTDANVAFDFTASVATPKLTGTLEAIDLDGRCVRVRLSSYNGDTLLHSKPGTMRCPTNDLHHDERGRAGAIEVPAGLELVLIEGVGAGQRALTPHLDAVVWVQSDFAEAERRGIARDIAEGVNGDTEAAARFWHEWMAAELAFVEEQRQWERACVVVAGTPTRAHGSPGSHRGWVELAVVESWMYAFQHGK